jgi:hypothetical protein
VTTPDKSDVSDHGEEPARRLLERLSWSEPFNKEASLNNPNPSVFDPAKVERASEPRDVDEFIRYTHEARNGGR